MTDVRTVLAELLSQVKRVELVPEGASPTVERWADHWRFSLQDDGHTLKLFATGKGAHAQAERDQALARDVTQGVAPYPQEWEGAHTSDESTLSPNDPEVTHD